MIDFHSHILPAIDDGSQSVEESLSMLRALKDQGVDTVVATSHFYATHRSPESYLNRRNAAFEVLKQALTDDCPRIILGAEVLYFPGISRMDALESLCTEGTDLLLLEMPFTAWSRQMVAEVNEMARAHRVQLVMAHIERYYFKQDVSVWDEFLRQGILMQSNADFFLPFWEGRKALKLLREGRIHLLGTDCHNMRERRPRMDEAASRIRRALGEETLQEINTLGHQLLREVLV